MEIAVTGGTGTLGGPVVEALVRRGHGVRVLTRHAPSRPLRGATHRAVDLSTGEGLRDALAGADAVIDAANRRGSGRRAAPVLVEGTRRLIDAAAAEGVGHVVEISIVGIDQVPFSYYRAKLEQERVVEAGAVPWSIVRATQFHQLLDWAFGALARAHLVPGDRLALQPVDPRVVAGVLADTIERGPQGRAAPVAGPQVESLRDLASTWTRARERRVLAVPLPARAPCPPGAGGRRAGAGRERADGRARLRGLVAPVPHRGAGRGRRRPRTLPRHAMSPAAAVAAGFEALRPRLLRVAYSQLGSLAEAEDVVQEAWLRLERADAAAIEDLGAWLTTVVSRLALDVLGSARARREQYVGPWLPDPLVRTAAPEPDPADRVTLDESVSLALLLVLERCPGRARAFVLHDIFGYRFEEVGEVVGRTRRRRAGWPRARAGTSPSAGPAGRERRAAARLVEAFARATAEGDIAALVNVLDPDVVMLTDGGGRVQAARKPLRGRRPGAPSARRAGPRLAARRPHGAGRGQRAPRPARHRPVQRRGLGRVI